MGARQRAIGMFSPLKRAWIHYGHEFLPTWLLERSTSEKNTWIQIVKASKEHHLLHLEEVMHRAVPPIFREFNFEPRNSFLHGFSFWTPPRSLLPAILAMTSSHSISMHYDTASSSIHIIVLVVLLHICCRVSYLARVCTMHFPFTHKFHSLRLWISILPQLLENLMYNFEIAAYPFCLAVFRSA
jgi:hypothetical protein